MYDLYIFDKDQTLSSPFPAWARESEKAFRQVAKMRSDARGADENSFFDDFIADYNRKRIATEKSDTPFKVTTWYWHLENMIDAVDILHPQNDDERMLFAQNDLAICKQYDIGRKGGVEAFAGIPEVIQELDARGNPLAILSDGRISEIASAMEKVSISPEYFQAVLCQKDEKQVFETAGFHGNVIYYEGKKPEAPSVKAAVQLITDFGITAGNIVVIGDNKADALLSKALKDIYQDSDVCIEFAWAKYGAALNDQTVWFNNDLLQDPYPLGVAANEKGIRAVGVMPEHILNAPGDILKIRPCDLVF